MEVTAVTELLLKLERDSPEESICVLARTNRLLNMAYEKAGEKRIACARSKRKDGVVMDARLGVGDLLKALCKFIDGSFGDEMFEKSFYLNLVEGKVLSDLSRMLLTGAKKKLRKPRMIPIGSKCIRNT